MTPISSKESAGTCDRDGWTFEKEVQVGIYGICIRVFQANYKPFKLDFLPKVRFCI